MRRRWRRSRSPGWSISPAQDAGSLPLGTRRLLEVARCVAGAPNVLLLDEPAAGLDGDSLRDLGSLLQRTREAGGTVVIVEHNVPFVMSLADNVFVMELGKVIASGPPETVRRDERVIDSYLGRRHRNGSKLMPAGPGTSRRHDEIRRGP